MCQREKDSLWWSLGREWKEKEEARAKGFSKLEITGLGEIMKELSGPLSLLEKSSGAK